MTTIAIAIALIAIFEGLVIALAPNFYRQAMQLLDAMTREQRRFLGLSMAGFGALVIWVILY